MIFRGWFNSYLHEANMIDSNKPLDIKTQSTHSPGIKDLFQFREIMNKITTSQGLGSQNSAHESNFEEGKLIIINYINLISLFSIMFKRIIIHTDQLFSYRRVGLIYFKAVRLRINPKSEKENEFDSNSQKQTQDLGVASKECTMVDVRFKKI